MGIQLVMQRADGSERAFPVLKPRFVIGRAPRCDLRVAVPAVSPEHCEINLIEDEVRLANLNAAQVTLVNGQRIDQARRLQPEDIVTIGPVRFRIRELPASTEKVDAPEVHITRLTPPLAVDEAPGLGLGA